MKNHFPGSARCPSTPKVHNVYADDDDDSFSDEELPTQYWLGSLGTSGKSNKNRVFAKMSVCNREVVFQLDSGAETNTIGEQYVDCELVRPTSKTLRTWYGSQVRPVGETTLAVLNPRTNETRTTDFIVVPKGFSNFLGLPTLGIMNLIHVNRDIFDIASISEQDVIRTNPTVFVDAQGKLPGKTTLHVSESHKPTALPARNLPFAVRDDTKMELNRLVKQGILAPVTEPTEWVSQMAVTKKKWLRARLHWPCTPQSRFNEGTLQTTNCRWHSRQVQRLPSLLQTRCEKCLLAHRTRWRIKSTHHHDHPFWSLPLVSPPIWTLCVQRNFSATLDRSLSWSGGCDLCCWRYRYT